MKKTTDAILFEATMAALWDNDEETTRVVTALASYVKNHRANVENAFDVLSILWPEAKMKFSALAGDARPSTDDPSEVWFEITFTDESRCDVQALRGIGCAVEQIR